jgi:branched-chain amino acid transport system permease protein
MTPDLLLLFLEQGVASGLVSGSVYALLALAIVMIFKAAEVPNFAQGDVFMAAGYVAFYLYALRGAPAWLVVPATLVLGFALLALFQAVVLRRVQAARGTQVNLVIATLGLSYLLKGIVRNTGLGDTPRTLPALVSTASVQIGQATLTWLDLTILAVAVLVLAGVFAMFAFTRTGRAMRAVGMNPRAARLVGIDLGRMHALVWGLSGMVSAVAVLLIAPKLLMTTDMGDIVTMGFAAAIIGGFTSLPGAVVGGLLIGIAENLVGLFVSAQAMPLAPFLAIMLVLVLRPQGLFGGSPQQRKV